MVKYINQLEPMDVHESHGPSKRRPLGGELLSIPKLGRADIIWTCDQPNDLSCWDGTGNL